MQDARNPGRRLVFVGCGNMGAALAKGYLRSAADAAITVVDPDLARARAILPRDRDVVFASSIAAAMLTDALAIVLAVKPQSMASVLPLLTPMAAASGLIISIAAGTSSRTIGAVLPEARIVRAMPNTPALIGAGVTGLWVGAESTYADKALCETLFGAVGMVRWVTSEAAIDAVTAVSGSGPAYVFAFAEAMAASGVRLGLGPVLSEALARETIAGAAAMLRQPGAEPSALKAAVRSPAGTTDAALRVFETSDALADLMNAALDAAHRRAGELSRGARMGVAARASHEHGQSCCGRAPTLRFPFSPEPAARLPRHRRGAGGRTAAADPRHRGGAAVRTRWAGWRSDIRHVQSIRGRGGRWHE